MQDCSACLDELLVQYCSPTLAGIKASNMFRVAVQEESCIRHYLEYGNRKLNGKGIHAKCLRHCNGSALILVYRKKDLQGILDKPEVRLFLEAEGYCQHNVESCLTRLSYRMKGNAFPHEIGIFLGYPLPDVQGFIANGGRNYRFSGYWKVYSDEENTRRRFLCIDRVCRKFKECFLAGNTIDQLTVCKERA